MDHTRQFVADLTSSQSKLYAFILSLVVDSEQAKDILQNTNVVLWEKSSEFEPGTNFMAWAYKVAQFEVLAYRKKRSRDQLVFSEELLTQLAGEVADRNIDLDERLEKLQGCLNRLPDQHREMIRKRYSEGASLKDIAAAISRTANNVGVMLHRLRVALLDCMTKIHSSHGGNQ